MKAVFNREGLLTAFQIATSVVPTRSPKPILQHVKLELTKDGAAILSATDLELGIRYRITGVTVEEPGEVILPASEVNAILRELPDDELLLQETEGGVRLVGSSSKFELSSEDPLQYPEFPDFGDAIGHKIKNGVFATMIRRTVFAVASEDSRYALNSVGLELEKDLARLVATDGKRLAVMSGSVEIAGEEPEGMALIRSKVLSLLQRVLLDPDETSEFTIGPSEILFRTGKVVVYGRLAEGRFPRYQDVFPGKAKFLVPLVVGRFLGAIRQARIVTNEESKGVDFLFADGQLTLESQAADVGQSEVKVPIGYDGTPIKITFDPQFLLDVLRILEPEEEVVLEMVDEKKASVLRTKDGYAYLIMPLARERERQPERKESVV